MFAPELVNRQAPNTHKLQNAQTPGFFFRKRVERIDWKRLGESKIDSIFLLNIIKLYLREMGLF